MPKQQGHNFIQGSINGLTYTRSKNGGYKVRAKGNFDGKRVATDPAFELTRHNMSEFTKAANAGKLLRSALQGNLNFTADGSASRRLFAVMNRIIKSDPVNQRGLRSVMQGDELFLKGFEFNEKSPLESTLAVKTVSTIDRATGQVILDIPAIIPANDIYWPEGSTHCKIKSIAVAIDFEAGVFESSQGFTANIPLNRDPLAAINLVTQVEANSTKLLLHLVAIEFMMIQNGFTYQIKNQAYNAMSIVQVNATA
jgi:hypothetical protein